MKVVLCETMLKPSVVSVPSESRGDGTTYEVVASTLFNDSFCTCPGYQFRGYCKHVTMVKESRCTYHQPANVDRFDEWMADQLDECPTCGAKLVLFDLEPEFE